MNLFVCVKVEEVGGYEPLCATAVALSEEEAVRKLLEFADEKPETFTDSTLKDPFGLAEELSGDNCHYYVEAHEVQQ